MASPLAIGAEEQMTAYLLSALCKFEEWLLDGLVVCEKDDEF
jgi:hypothetical protein